VELFDFSNVKMSHSNFFLLLK